MYGSMVWHTHGIKVWIGGGMIKSLFKVEGQKYGMHSHGMVWYGMPWIGGGVIKRLKWP